MVKGKVLEFPLTDVQWAYYIGRDKSFGSAGVSTHFYNEFQNTIDTERFEIALNKVINRHQMLRAVFVKEGWQTILPAPVYYKVKCMDLREMDYKKQLELIEKKRDELSHYVYNPGEWPLFTFETALLSEQERYMFVGVDMLIADSESIAIMINEIVYYYNNPDSELPLPDVTFSEYIDFYQQQKESKKYLSDQQYWKEKIPEFPGAPKLPAHAGETEESAKYERLMHVTTAEEWNLIKSILAGYRLLPMSFLCTCYTEVLAKWSREQDFSINVTLSNRNKLKGCTAVIGDFTSLMIVPFSGNGQTDDLFERAMQVQNQFIKAYSHSTYDGILIERDVAKYNGYQADSLFSVVFTSLLGIDTDSETESFLGKSTFSLSQTSQVHLDCQVSEESDKLIITWDYNASIYDRHMIGEIFTKYVKLILLALKNKIADYKKVLEVNSFVKEKIENYNHVSKQIQPGTLQELVESALKQYRNQTAIIIGVKSYTYSDADAESEKYAEELRENNIGCGCKIGVFGAREAETVFKILGIIKTGAAYVPINPEYPKKRKQFILNDSGCCAYFTRSLELLDIPLTNGKKAYPKDLAYTIYTSGSTGRPKGVRIAHQSVYNTVIDINERFAVEQKDVILNVSSYGFDLSVYDIFGTLAAGGTMVIAADPRYMKSLKSEMLKSKVTIWNSVPAILELLTEEFGEDETDGHMRLILLSGDWIPLSLVPKLKRIFPNAQLISLGGATEASIWSIFYKIDDIRAEWNSIPYGYPLENQTCYILDRSNRLCPTDVAGEICIGGIGVAQGYTDYGLTKKSFFDHSEYGRLYKTGDLGIFRKEGYIDILGRIDQQVKINGYRIEIEEIEKRIEAVPYIKKAFVDVHKAEGHQQIIAYIVPDKNIKTNNYVPLKEINIQANKVSRSLLPDLMKDANPDEDIELSEISLENMWTTLYNLVTKAKLQNNFSLDQLINSCEIKPIYKKLIRNWLHVLAEHDYLSISGGTFKRNDKWVQEKGALITRIDTLLDNCKDTAYKYKILLFFQQCILYTEEILTGRKNIIDLLYKDGELKAANSLYSENPRSKYNNRILAEIIKTFILNRTKEKPVKILEIGAGTGGATLPVLQEIGDLDIDYNFTDVSKFFTDHAKELLQEYSGINYGFYDIDQKYQSQGYQPEYYDIIMAANVMHDAKSLKDSLTDIYEMLKPGGMAIFLEVTEDSYTYMTSLELLEGYSNYDDFRTDTGHALLTRDGWVDFLEQQGFEHSGYYPAGEAGVFDLGENIIVGFKRNISVFLNEELKELSCVVSEHLPNYMIPGHYIQLNEIPLNANGKIDKSKLPELISVNGLERNAAAPETETEKEIYAIWTALLGEIKFGVDDDFFMLGGDSLVMIRMLSNIEGKLNCRVDNREFMQQPTIRSLACNIEAIKKETI